MDVEFPNHPPEIFKSIRQRALRGDIIFLECEGTSIDMEIRLRILFYHHVASIDIVRAWSVTLQGEHHTRVIIYTHTHTCIML